MSLDNEDLNLISREFFNAWRQWRLSQGWTLGPDRPDSKMSPYLVHSWEGLNVEGKQWFVQHSALVLYATQQGSGSPSKVEDSPANSGVNDKVIQKLNAGIVAIDELKTETARRKIRTALKLLKGEPIRRKKVHRKSVRPSSTP